MTPRQVVEAVRPRDDPHEPISAAVTFENTHNRHGGIVWPLDALREASDAAHKQGLRVHLDGARIFNAAVALGVDASEIAACADTLTFCLSKGLACPIGSIFCGSEADVEEARRWRKRLGGGMRQVGVLAAAGLIALDRMVGSPRTTPTRAPLRKGCQSCRACGATSAVCRRTSSTSTWRRCRPKGSPTNAPSAVCSEAQQEGAASGSLLTTASTRPMFSRR